MVKNKTMNKGLVLSEAKGFTLIELIVVIAIMAIMTGIGLAYFNKFNEEKKISGEVSRLVDVLHLARSKSMAGDLSPMPACTDFSGYQVEIIQTAYSFVFCCGDCTGGNKIPLQSHTLYSTVLADNTYSLLFKPSTGVVNTGLTSEKTITFTDTSISKSATVTVQNSGLISYTNLTAL